MSTRQLLFAIVEFLQQPQLQIEPDSLEIAVELLSTAGQFDTKNAAHRELLSNPPLLDIFQAGLLALKRQKDSPTFNEFCKKLDESGYFRGVDPWTSEYATRLERARGKFEEKFAASARKFTSQGQPASASAAAPSETAPEAAVIVPEPPAPAAPATTTTTTPMPAPASVVVDAVKAEESKKQGNSLLGQGLYKEAADAYTRAIEFDPTNAIYYSNRSVAKTHLNLHDEAIADNQLALQRDPQYSKAWHRLGKSQATLGQHQEAIASFESGLQVCSNDANMTSLIQEQLALSKKAVLRASGVAELAGSNPELAEMLRDPKLAGLMEDPKVAEMMNNPEIAAMLENPQIAQMAKGFLGSMNSGSGFNLAELMQNPMVAQMAAQFMKPKGQ